jgi:hypothetical protein
MAKNRPSAAVPQLSASAPQPEDLDDLLAEAVGRTGHVRQPGKGVWKDEKTGQVVSYRVVGADEPEEGKFTLALESVGTLRRFIKADEEKGTDARWEDTGRPRSIVPHCPVKWFHPDPATLPIEAAADADAPDAAA